jgi:hypothetical protein
MEAEMGMKEFHAIIEADIQQYGRSVIGVKDHPPFSYTIGNSPRGLPELLVFGMSNGQILDVLSDMMIERGRAFDDGELVHLGGACPIKMICADWRAKDDYTVQAGVHYHTEHYDVQQVLIPDPDGRFPDDPGCLFPYRDVPILRGN